MKKTLPIIAALTSLVGVAHAQSSVTLYGLIDDGLTYSSNAKGSSQYSMTAGNLEGSRWGMRGVEDLGGGLNAIFRLEGGFSPANGTLGQGGALFGRKAYVGLSSALYGTLTAGRQYDPAGDYVSGFESGNAYGEVTATQWGSIYGAHPGDMDNLDNSFRINNTVKYTSPSYRGLSTEVLYSFGGQAGDFTRNQLYGLAAGYANGPLALGAAFEKAKDPNYSLFGTNPSSNTATSTSAINASTPVYNGYLSAGAWQLITAGGAYRIGNATIGGVYSNVQFQNVGSVSGAGLNPGHLSGTATFNIGEINLAYLVTPSLQLGVAYSYTRGSSIGTNSGASYSQFNLGANYLLSKRTDLYLVGIHQHASGVDSTGKAAVAAIPNLSNSSSDVQTAIVFGVRHRF